MILKWYFLWNSSLMAIIRRSVVKKTSTSSFRSSLTFEFPIFEILLTKKEVLQALTFIKITLNPISDNSISIRFIIWTLRKWWPLIQFIGVPIDLYFWQIIWANKLHQKWPCFLADEFEVWYSNVSEPKTKKHNLMCDPL